MKRVKKNLNPLHNDLNPWIWSCEEHVRDSNPLKKDLNLISRMKLKVEDQTEGFESSSYGFKSLVGDEFKYCTRDSNP